VDIHLKALTDLGVQIEITKTSYHAWAKNGLHGADIELRFPSVGATENAILAAVLAKGKTTIKNAALEPELMNLIMMLQKMGAIIELAPPRTITIEGVEKLHGVRHAVIPTETRRFHLPVLRSGQKENFGERRRAGTPHYFFECCAEDRRRI